MVTKSQPLVSHLPTNAETSIRPSALLFTEAVVFVVMTAPIYANRHVPCCTTWIVAALLLAAPLTLKTDASTPAAFTNAKIGALAPKRMTVAPGVDQVVAGLGLEKRVTTQLPTCSNPGTLRSPLAKALKISQPERFSRGIQLASVSRTALMQTETSPNAQQTSVSKITATTTTALRLAS